MNVWRLIPFHKPERKNEFADWIQKNETIAIGWGQTGDLGQQPFSDEAEMKRTVAEAHSDYTSNSKSNGGKSLWRFHDEMQIGDLVIITGIGPRRQTMRVTGDYYYVNTGDDPTHYYEHRKKAKFVPINPDRLWRAVNRVAPGEGIYTTLVRCDRKLTEAELIALSD